jgi:hypothetical protein
MRGRQADEGDAAIQTWRTIKVLFFLALRQTSGFVESLLGLFDLDWAEPNFSTLSRRRKTLKVNIPHRGSQDTPHLLIDSTRIEIEGEGEWKARQHGESKRQVWRKMHNHYPSAQQQRQALKARHPKGHRPQRSSARIKTLWSDHLVTMDRA